VCLHEERHIGLTLGQGEALLSHLLGHVYLSALPMPRRQSPQDRHELWRVPHLPTQLIDARQDLPSFRGPKAFDRL
jgi:hypothetical protein